MIRPGLVSVTFRRLGPAEVVRWAAKAGLDGIEWGGDVHVPHGDIETAREVAALTREAGLEVAAYGSYYRAGEEGPGAFSEVLDTALALGAPLVRVWAGRAASADADESHRRRVVDDCRRVAETAGPQGLRVVSEWHGGTLTDTAASAAALFEAVGHPDFGTYWQPRSRMPLEDCMRDMDAALPRLAGLHVFQWDVETMDRRPLSEGEEAWRRYLARAAGAGDMFALLEFVMGDDPERMVRDAATLRGWLEAPDAARPR